MKANSAKLIPDARQEEYERLDTAFDALFPLMRSITGPGIEASMDYFSRFMGLTIEKVATGTRVFDWIVPKEWHFRSATIIGPDGDVVVDAANNNLHVVNYSCPVDETLPLHQLQAHLHSIESLPEAVPYVTSYYQSNWGFCLSDKQRRTLKPGNYHAKIDTAFVDGGVPFAHCTLEGECEKEIVISSYLCHPSMANNELSGPLVLLGLYQRLQNWKRRRWTYRFLLNPETIGALCFLSRYAKHLREKMQAGMVLTCLGGPEKSLLFKLSRMNDGLLDRAVRVRAERHSYRHICFTPLCGSDERQYCAPGFNFPVIQASKTSYGAYDGYHNSLDTKDFMSIHSLQESIDQLEALLHFSEYSGRPANLCPFGEPQLGKRNLYPNINSVNTRTHSGDALVDQREFLNYTLELLSLSDGSIDLVSIAECIGVAVETLFPIVDRLEQEGLIAYGRTLPQL